MNTKLEANLRFSLTDVRRNADSLVLQGVLAERLSARNILSNLGDCVNNLELIVTVDLRLSFFTNGYNKLVAIFPAALAAPIFSQGHVDFGDIVLTGMAFTQGLGGMTLLVSQFNGLR